MTIGAAPICVDCKRIRPALGTDSHALSSQGEPGSSRSGQHHRFGYLLEVLGVGRS